MVEIYQYETLTNTKKYPKYDEKRHTIVTRIKPIYQWFIEVREYNKDTNDYNYYILLSKDIFNENCKKVKYDDYGRMKIIVVDELHNEILFIIKNNKSFNFEYLDSNEYYDRYIIS